MSNRTFSVYPASPLYGWFLKAALILTLTSGAFLGVLILSEMAFAGQFAFSKQALLQAHGHVQIFGWVGLFVVGILTASFLPSANKKINQRLIGLCFGFLFVGIVGRLVGQSCAGIGNFGLLALMASAFEFFGITIAGVLFFSVLRRSGLAISGYFIASGLICLFLIGAVNLMHGYRIMAANSGIVKASANDSFLHLTLMGFVSPMIMGMSLKVLEVSFIERYLTGWLRLSLAMLYVGIVFQVLEPVLSREIRWIGSGLEITAGSIYLFVFGRIWTRTKRLKPGIQVSDSARFVWLAFFWFAVALLMDFSAALRMMLSGNPPAHVYVGAYRHALVVGFITTMMLGMAYWLVPRFAGRPLFSRRLASFSFYLIGFGNLARVIGQLGTVYFGRMAFLLTGISGYLELAALVLFSWNLWQTMSDRGRSSIGIPTFGNNLI